MKRENIFSFQKAVEASSSRDEAIQIDAGTGYLVGQVVSGLDLSASQESRLLGEDGSRMAYGVWKLAVGLTLATAVILAGGCRRPKRQPSRPPVPKTKPAPATPIDTKRAETGGPMWDPAWDKIVENALPTSMLSRKVPQDVRRFCPRFYSMEEIDKRAFWAYFFQALAGAEAGLKPRTRVRHTDPAVAVTDGVTGRAVRSEGLLQLTYEDERRYGCDFDWAADRNLKPDAAAKTILQPKNNLECGVKILVKQIIDKRKPLLSRTGYWSTLRPGTVSYRVFAKQMTNVPIACKARRETEIAHR